MKIVYVAGKFRGANAWEVHKNVQEALRVGFEVAALGAMPLIPHANTFPFDGTLEDSFWLDGTMELLHRCDAVMTVDNWTTSKGAKDEVHEAVDELGIPVFHELQHLVEWLAEDAKVKIHVSVFEGEGDDDVDVPAVMMCGRTLEIYADGDLADPGHDFYALSFFGPLHGPKDAIDSKISEVTCPTCRLRARKISDSRFAADRGSS